MLAIALLVLVAAVELEAAEINCEFIATNQRIDKCCFLNGTTKISHKNVKIGGLADSNVDAILFDGNLKIKFLPVKVHKKFPNLKFYSARDVAIGEISALNFARLSELKNLYLDHNEIQFIPDDCFKGLKKLQKIFLKLNQIKEVNGIAFANLPQLAMVDLTFNPCISTGFTIGSDSNEMRQKITRSCGSKDVTRKKILCSTSAVTCGDNWRDEGYKNLQCCELESETYIDAPDFSFATNSAYAKFKQLFIDHQRNVFFLPIFVHEQFPNLKFYEVINTPFIRISKKNFEKLSQLEELRLYRNKIEVIKSNTFEDLVNLKLIYIINQPLIALNGQAFANLNKLEHLVLENNQCINEGFRDNKTKSTAPEVISKRCGFEEIDSVEIECERFVNFFIDTCELKEKTEINATNFVVAELKDEDIERIRFNGNQKIEYLPYKIHMQFPNLIRYWASNCSIKQISKQNFEKLNRLENIYLNDNQIQKISGNTFKGLERLEKVDLSNNQIKSINGRTFDQLPLLTRVDLRRNECIDDILAPVGEEISCRDRKNKWGDLEYSEECAKIEPNLHHFLKNFTRKIIQHCAFTETGEREFEKVFDIECGVGKGGRGFIVGGNETERGQWPFLVALILVPENRFFCGGNIITTSHVLTAAHCIQHKYAEKPFEASQIVILLGRHDISLRAEIGSETRGVKNIIVHPHWKPQDFKYDGDIAVLEMDRPVQFSELIQPVCLTVEPEILQREAGYVIGYGNSGSEKLHETIPRQILISSVTAEVCFARDSSHSLGKMFAEKMFCAGGDGFGPCKGDSGGGYFVRYHGLWTLRGVVSSGTLRDDFGCDVDKYSLFTNAVDYAAWISEVVKTSTVTSKQQPFSGRIKQNHISSSTTPKTDSNTKPAYDRIYFMDNDQF